MATRAERMVDGIVGGREGEGKGRVDTREEEDESERDLEEEDEYQEDSSQGESGVEGEPKCSVCNSRGSVFSCDDCSAPLYESCAQSTIPFLCQFCMRKKRLREGECKSDILSG